MKNKIANNASWIIGVQVVKSVFAFLISMYTARYLGPSNYGLINYASALVAFFTPIACLGLNGVLVMSIVNEPEREGEILGTSILLSILSSILCFIAILAFVSIANAGEKETFIVCALYSVLLIFQSCELIRYWFQAKLLAKFSSVVSLGAYLIVSAYKVYLLITGKSVFWFAISNALDYFIIAASLLLIYRKLGGKKFSFSRERARALLSKSKYYILSGLMVVVFAQTDKIMLKLMIDEAATAYYSTAVSCAGLTGFVFTAIIDSFRPIVFENKSRNRELYEDSVCGLYSIIIYFALFQSLAIFLLSGFIIKILYGSQYLPAIPALRLIVWYSTFSYIGSVRNIWMLAENKQKYIWTINLCGAVANVVLNYILIPDIGIMGAALASLITQFFTNVIIGFIMKPIRYNNKLMLRSLNIRYLFSELSVISPKLKLNRPWKK